MSEQVKKTGMDHYRELQAKAKELGINCNMDTENLEQAIAEKKAGPETTEESDIKGPTGISAKDAVAIEAKLRFEAETRDKIRHERQIITDRAQIVAESESLSIPISLPENPTELELAKARQTLGIKKKEIKPSPETVAIEASKRGYYKFNNREQEDANHTAILGGKYFVELVADQIHVLSEYHVRKWGQIAVTPEYKRVSTGIVLDHANPGDLAEKCINIGGKPRFIFEYLGEAPQDAPFGLVTDAKILEQLTQPVS